MSFSKYNLRQLRLIIKNEYMTDIRGKGFWIATIVFPLLMGGFGLFIGLLATSSDSLKMMSNPMAPEADNMTAEAVLAMMLGMFLTLFLMIYGAQIFNKVKTEKSNRIMEIMATCVEGRTMMLAKIISVALVGLTQMALWMILLAVIVGGFVIGFFPDADFGFFTTLGFYGAIGLSLLYFTGGYVLYGSLFAAAGAMTDKNNENQEYMSILTFVLLASFYLGQFAVDNSSSALTHFCNYFPLTSPTVAAVNSISGNFGALPTVISLAVLYATAYLCLLLSGKIYRSSILLTGKKFSPKDIMVFLRAK